MDAVKKLKRVNQNTRFILIFIFASVLYLYKINFCDIWIDEAYTKSLVRHSYVEIIQLIKNDFHPPLYFFGLKFFVTIFWLNDFTIRLFSVLGILSTILLVYIIGQKVFGKSGSLYFCLLIVSLPMLAGFSHVARMYTWGAFAVTGTFIFASRFLLSNKRSDLTWLMIFTLMSAYTHYYAFLAAFWANVFVFATLLSKCNNQFKTHLIYSLIAFVLYLPWLTAVIWQTKKVADSFWVPALNWETFLVQVYVHKVNDADGPIKTLRCFQRVEVDAGKTAQVKIKLTPDAFKFFNEKKYEMAIEPGEYEVFYGSSSRGYDLKSVKVEIE